jgi:predicted nucleic acid-binding Zn ribbon protein
LTSLFSNWEAIVGADVAAHVRPLTLLRGTLVVGVDSPTWASHLRYQEADLVARFDAALGTGQVERVEVRVHPR